ncbi:MAG TPA: PAS domain-containing protein [Sphingobium sp.]
MDKGEGLATFRGDAPAAISLDILRDRRELALVALERTKVPMVVSDARKSDQPIVLANKAFLDLTGYNSDEIIGRNCLFLQVPDNGPADVAAIRAGLSDGCEVQVELLNYCRDGSTFWNQLVISPVTDETGLLIYFLASQHDIFARRIAQTGEQAERLLLMEVDHRAMNALALVQSFVRLGSGASIQTFATGVQVRVDALARAHRLLAQNKWSNILLVDLISSETPRAMAGRVFASGSPLMLAAKIVHPPGKCR